MRVHSLGTELGVVCGMQFNRGYLSPYFITHADKREANLKEPLVLLCARSLPTLAIESPLLNAVVQDGHPLLIIAKAVDAEALASLVVNKLGGRLKVAAVNAPGVGTAMLADIAIFTGGQLISEDLAANLENATIDMLGRAKTVVVKKDDTTILGGGGAEDKVARRVAQIRIEIESATSEIDKEELREREAMLVGS